MKTVEGTAIKERPARARKPAAELKVSPDPTAAPLAVRKKATAPAPTLADATTLLQAITQAASNPQVDIEKMERLFAMHQQMVKQDAIAAYNTAMSRAQASMDTVINDRTNDHTRSRYATRRAINRVIKPIYTSEGLSVEFDMETTNSADPVPQGMIRMVARVAHAGGHHERRHIDLYPDDTGSQGKVNKTKVQATGSSGEYGCRYLLKWIFNIATGDEEDDDGNGERREEGNGNVETPAKPAYADDQIEKNLTAWGQLVDAGKQTADSIIVKIKSKATLTEGQEATIRKALA